MAELFEERLCELVRNYCHIFDVSSPGHRDKHLVQNSWEEIGRELNVPWTVAKEKWRQVRDRFVRAHNKSASKRSGDAADGSQDHPILRRLGWLKPFINHRATATNYPKNDMVRISLF